jgi:hypothetical protein
MNSDREARRAQFAKAIFRLPGFAPFLQILSKHSEQGCSHLDLGRELRNALQLDWKDGTGQTNAKIMLDWARQLGLAPAVFAERRPRRTTAENQSNVAPVR